MKKVLFVNPDSRHTCSFYRSAGVMRNLRNQLGANFQIECKTWQDVEVTWNGIGDYDLIMFQRPFNNSMKNFCTHVKEMNVKLWIDFDDNLFAVGPENRAFQIYSNKETHDNVNEITQMADVVSVTTEHLKKQLSKLNDNIVVIPNAFNDTIFDKDREVEDRDNTVLWRGSDTHIYDMMSHGAAIGHCTKNNPTWEFTYVGFNPWFLEESKNIQFIRPMEIVDYFNGMFRLKPAVVQVPLNDTNFNRCKSNIAMIEASYWGAVSLIPTWWGEIPGTIAYDSPEEYEEGLQSVLDGDVDVKAESAKTWEYVKENLLLSDINKIRVKLINDILNDE